MPDGVVEKARDFYERISKQVIETDVSELTRKRLVALKVDLDDIVDSIVQEVRQSPDGLFTNYLNTKVKNETMSLEEACFNVGLQLKAYGVDITNYRNIAGVVLGVPVVPHVASTVVDVGKGIRKAATPIAQLPGSAFNTMSQMASPVAQLGGSAIGSVSQMASPMTQLGGSAINSLSQMPGSAFNKVQQIYS